MSKIIRVVPVPNDSSGASKTQGTAVYVGDERISVQKLTMIAEPRNVWRAIIETTVQLDGYIVAALTVPTEQPTPPPPRLMCGACGDVTHKPHGWLCRAMAAIDRWTGMRTGKDEPSLQQQMADNMDATERSFSDAQDMLQRASGQAHSFRFKDQA